MKKSTTAKNCYLCRSDQNERVLELTPTPPANAFVHHDELNLPQECYPLDLYLCLDCGHVQLFEVIDPRILFENYVYVSGTSPVFVSHFEDYAKVILSDFNIPKGSFVVDIGSNDGTLLKFFQKSGMSVLGIDPAIDIAIRATASGIETLPLFFSSEQAERIRRERGPASVITANNVFAHSGDLIDFVKGIHCLLADDGIFVFEVSYLMDVYEKTLFDTIYHEHLSYHTVGALDAFFSANDLNLIQVKRVESHGGSLRGIVQRLNGPLEKDESVTQLIKLESALGLNKPEVLKAFGNTIGKLKSQLKKTLLDIKKSGNRIVGFGAPAKATTLMYHFGIGGDTIDFIIDDSPFKQGLYTPGLHIPVLPSSALYEEKPDYILILAWNFADAIIKKNQAFSEAGGKFIVPLPEINVR